MVLEDMLEDAAVDPVRELLEDKDTAYLYLAERWLTDVVAKLRDARLESDLTQHEIAERLGTKQPAIARLESDHEGKFSLRRFVEYALACGALPLDLSLESAEEVRRCALGSPGEPITETAYENWLDFAAVKGTIVGRHTPAAEHEFRFALHPGHEAGPRQMYELDHYSYSNKGTFLDERRSGDFLAQSRFAPCPPAERSHGTKSHGISQSGKALDRQEEFKLAS